MGRTCLATLRINEWCQIVGGAVRLQRLLRHPKLDFGMSVTALKGAVTPAITGRLAHQGSLETEPKKPAIAEAVVVGSKFQRVWKSVVDQQLTAYLTGGQSRLGLSQHAFLIVTWAIRLYAAIARYTSIQ